ncbi:MAG TPA: isopentenyl-diphosphate Delta-isomerase [Bacteroidia bacterium]|nr:isopentenyl-diphosphate Delta-isomerase [Bacteroidia bacterium]
MEEIILVDSHDREKGKMEKLQAHREGWLHRAVSVFVFNSKGELLIQRRAAGKYHSPALWTNTCCGHPRPGEQNADAAARRLREEMGMNVPLEEIFSFVYKVKLADDLFEHEFDHVFTGRSDELPRPDPDEVMEWKYASLEELMKDTDARQQDYTIWFLMIFREAFKWLK